MFTQAANGLYLEMDLAETVVPVQQVRPTMPRTHRMFQLVQAGFTNKAAVAKIKEEYGDNVPTKSASISWCRTAMKNNTEYAQNVLARINNTKAN